MSEIDRRTLLTVAGAGIVVAGCGSGAGDAENNQLAQGKPVTTLSGSCDLWGQSVRDPRPLDERLKPMGSVQAFAPDKICIVLIRFEAAGRMTVRRTYIDMPDPANITAEVWTALTKMSAGTTVNSAMDRKHIDPIALVGQRLLVLYIDNDPNFIRFKYERDGSDVDAQKRSYEYTLRCTKYRGSELGREAKKNHALFNADRMTFTGVAIGKADTAFTLEYWDTNGIGNPVENVLTGQSDSHFIYSLNILLEIKAPTDTGDKWVPIIVDPDTGNMGAEP